MNRWVAWAMAAVLLAAGVLVLRAETMSTHSDAPPGSTTEVVFRLVTRTPRSPRTVEAMARAMVTTCRLEVAADLAGATETVGPATYRFALTPALDESDRRQLVGCLQDVKIDYVQGVVVEVRSDLTAGPPADRAAP